MGGLAGGRSCGRSGAWVSIAAWLFHSEGDGHGRVAAVDASVALATHRCIYC